jgi:hypothetical protein
MSSLPVSGAAAAVVPDHPVDGPVSVTDAHVVVLPRMAVVPAVYTVQPGDSLSAIAQKLYGSDVKWPYLYAANEKVVGGDPNIIQPGQKLDETLASVPAYGSSGGSFGGSTPVLAAARSAPADPPAADGDGDHDGDTSDAPASDQSQPAVTAAVGSSTGGTLGCGGLEALWTAAGGAPGEAFMAAEIAMAESGGNQFALSPTNDYGYWQINGSHGPGMATFNAIGNAHAAIAISNDGTDWGAWTTYTSGAYAGRC